MIIESPTASTLIPMKGFKNKIAANATNNTGRYIGTMVLNEVSVSETARTLNISWQMKGTQ